ncbi:MAG TPA: hypothetical protein VGV86_13340 [Acidimicrobiales bacterium]|nr:hypothetical protein [Acidimicrobiales bacterium]
MNVKEFYDEDDRRRRSREVAFGLGWTIDSDPFVLYGLHWIEETREIYVVRGPQIPQSPDAWDTDVPFWPVMEDAYEAILLGWADSEEILHAVLDGWQHRMTEANGLQWVRIRLYQAAAEHAPSDPHGPSS